MEDRHPVLNPKSQVMLLLPVNALAGDEENVTTDRSATLAGRSNMRGSNGWGVWLRGALAISDLLVLAVAAVVAQAIVIKIDPSVEAGGSDSPFFISLSVVIGLVWWVALGNMGSRDPRALGHGPQELQNVFRASWRAFAIVAVLGFLTQWQISRAYLLTVFLLGIVGLLLARGLWRIWIHAQRDRGLLASSVLIVGTREKVIELAARFTQARRTGFRVVGVSAMKGPAHHWSGLAAGISSFDTLDEPVAQAHEIGAEYIVVAGNEALSFQESRKLGWALEGSDIGLLIAPSLADVAGPRVQVTPVAGLPLLDVRAPTFSGSRYAVKAVLDRLGALLLLLVAAVPMLAILVAVKLSSPGPAFFVQERLGLGMKPFRMLKFRSMYADAELRLEDLLDNDEGSGALFKMKDDPRITTVGRFLRRFSLDELPQLFNVLMGHMSLVGPRPPLAREAELWEPHVERRQLVKPGLTGLWQVSGRSDLTWQESVRLDLSYAENWTLGGDIVIIIRTIYAVLKPRGAY